MGYFTDHTLLYSSVNNNNIKKNKIQLFTTLLLVLSWKTKKEEF